MPIAVRSQRPSARRNAGCAAASTVDIASGCIMPATSREGVLSGDPMHTTLPRRFYADADFYRAELERFYFDRWICAGRADQIAQAGDYFTRTIGDETVIVTRDTAGGVHALFNVCRHRGT